MDSHKNINFLILKFFAPVLILTGILGYLIPQEYSLMSTSGYYNIFHIAAGLIGLLIALIRNMKAVIAFNIAFGLLDLYQAAASFLNIFPDELINYTLTDDILHVVIGIVLVLAGVFGKKSIEE